MRALTEQVGQTTLSFQTDLIRHYSPIFHAYVFLCTFTICTLSIKSHSAASLNSLCFPPCRFSVNTHPAGQNFNITEFFVFSDQYPLAQVQLLFNMQYAPKIMQPKMSDPVVAQSFLSRLTSKAKGNEKTDASAGNKEIAKPSRKTYQLRVLLYQARDLPALDDNGLSDPYVVVSLAGKRLETQPIDNTFVCFFFVSSSNFQNPAHACDV
jgi:hypothetical protein